MSNSVTRSTVNEQQYSAPDFQKSGFALSHRKYGSYLIGRMQASGYQWLMPGDKVSGQNKGNFTMKRLVTPMVSDLEVAQYNFFLPFRAIDRTFERNFAPSKTNAMSAAWETPKVSTKGLVKDILTTYFTNSLTTPNSTPENLTSELLQLAIGDTTHNLTWLATQLTGSESLIANDASILLYGTTGFTGIIPAMVESLTTGDFATMAQKLYIDDALLDIVNNINVKLGTADSPLSGSLMISDFLYDFLDCLFTPFIGRYSYYADFGYKFLRPNDIYRIVRKIGLQSTIQDWDDFSALFDSTGLCEYPLRVMYTIWYEKFRNRDLEPVNSNLPDWRDFGSTSIFDLANGGNLCYLLYRIRPWYEDMFTTAQIDDLSRHVFTPIFATPSGNSAFHELPVNNHDTNYDGVTADVGVGSGGPSQPKPSVYVLTYLDQISGTQSSISCPVPTNINDILSQNDTNFEDVYGLDLNTLRQSQQLERYLKRNYLFGDEYQDRMLAHYQSRVSDNRINRPELISQSLNNSNMEQEIANMSNGISEAGDRTATGTLTASGDQFTMFAEEFGLLVNLITFMPLASYDGICPQLLLSKQIDFPLPEFATNNEEFGRKVEIADSALDPLLVGSDASDSRFIFGRYPAYHAWRQRVDVVGGDFLNELQDCTFRRFWGMYSDDTTPRLNYYFLHCRPNLGMFANTNMYDAQIYGDVVHECYVERVLPTPVEVI